MSATYNKEEPGPLLVVPGDGNVMYLYRHQGGLLPDLIRVMTKAQFEKEYKPQ